MKITTRISSMVKMFVSSLDNLEYLRKTEKELQFYKWQIPCGLMKYVKCIVSTIIYYKTYQRVTSCK